MDTFDDGVVLVVRAWRDPTEGDVLVVVRRVASSRLSDDVTQRYPDVDTALAAIERWLRGVTTAGDVAVTPR